MSVVALVSSLLLASTAPDLFVTRQTQAQSTNLPDVQITGVPTPERVRAFVNQIAAPPQYRGLARWEMPVCPGTVNLDREAAQPILDRVALAAQDIDLEIGEPGCDPNLVFIFTTDGSGLANAMVEMDRSLFYVGVGGLNRGPAALREFQASDAPVRWWPMSIPVNSETGERAVRIPGEPHSRSVPLDVARAVGCGNPDDCALGAPIIQTTSASRLHSMVSDALYKTIVIVDVDEIGDVNAVRLGDYLAFVSLAQIDPDAETTGFDTVLNLFDGGGEEGMTQWDRSYLQALYNARTGFRAPSSQAAEVINLMTRDRRAAARAE
jgi:hypothetical protein